MAPTLRNGKICYIEIPTTDVARSAAFYNKTFGWKMRQRGDGATSFDDSVGEVSGAFVTDRPPASTPGFMVYVMVDSVVDTCDSIAANGGEVLEQHIREHDTIARFRDPFGNVLGLYQD